MYDDSDDAALIAKAWGEHRERRRQAEGKPCPQRHNRPPENAFEDLAHCRWCNELLIDPPGIVSAPKGGA